MPRRARYYPRYSPRIDYLEPVPYNIRTATATTATVEHRHFTSSGDFAAWCVTNDIASHREDQFNHGDGFRCQEGIQVLTHGDNTNVQAAESLLEELSIQVDVPTQTWRNDLVGAFPNVPAYVSGDPECMWYRAADLSDRTPVRIYVGIASTWYITEEQLRARGIALAAFAIALSNQRPVYVTPFVNGHDYNNQHKAIISWDLVTSPLVLSELLGCVSNPSVTRHIHIPAVLHLNHNINRSVPFANITQADLPNFTEQDIYLPPIVGTDPLLNNPVKWIKDTLAKYSDTQEN